MTLAEAYQAGKQILLDAGIREYGLDAWYLLEFVTGVNKAAFYLEPKQRITESQKAEFLSYIRERAKRVPLQYPVSYTHLDVYKRQVYASATLP